MNKSARRASGTLPRGFALVRVRARPGKPTQGWLAAGALVRMPVALGRGGIRANKREGDGATPRGRFRLVRLWWRADRLPRPTTLLPARAIRARDAWCEDPLDRRYNRPFLRTAGESGDSLRRADALYDLVIELDHNTRPRIRGGGSAVFVHVARPAYAPTAGCVALRQGDLRRLLARLRPYTRIEIQ